MQVATTEDKKKKKKNKSVNKYVAHTDTPNAYVCIRGNEKSQKKVMTTTTTKIAWKLTIESNEFEIKQKK